MAISQLHAARVVLNVDREAERIRKLADRTPIEPGCGAAAMPPFWMRHPNVLRWKILKAALQEGFDRVPLEVLFRRKVCKHCRGDGVE